MIEAIKKERICQSYAKYRLSKFPQNMILFIQICVNFEFDESTEETKL